MREVNLGAVAKGEQLWCHSEFIFEPVEFNMPVHFR